MDELTVRSFRWWILIAVVSVITWLYWHSAPSPPEIRPVEIPFRSGPQVFDCEKDAPLQPLSPLFDDAQRAAIMAKLREACREQVR